ncbi:hypothetical protein [Nocardiopsis coralliicola]
MAELFREAKETVQAPTESGQLWRKALFFVPAPLPLLAVVALAVGGTWSAPGVWILAALSISVASALLAAVVQPSPLPEGLSTGASVRRSLHRFRQITSLRIALALAPVVVAAGFSIAGGGLFPLGVALVLSWPQLALAAPTFFTITRARRAMETWGTKAYLWAGLAQPAPVEWPLVTSCAAYLRRWREERAARAAAAPQAAGESAEDEDPDGTDAPDGAAEAATGLPTRLAAPSAPRLELDDLLPGLAGDTTATGPRPIVRGPAPGRRTAPRSRRRDRRSAAKN